ncbi:MAG: tetratricopeptide repeat protein [Pseudomonadota bacterium]
MSSRPSLLLPLVLSLALLAACDSSEERAEAHFQSGIELFEAGDVDRALVELRNVLSLDARHMEARKLFADIIRDRGKWGEAYRNYTTLVEMYPSETELRIVLADMAVRMGRWDDAVYHGNRVITDAPDDPRVQVISAALDFRSAISRRDTAARRDAAGRTETLLASLDDPSLAREIVIDNLIRDKSYVDALVHVRAAIDDGVVTEEKFRTKLSLLGEIGDEAGFGAGLEQAVAAFPQQRDFADDLIGWYTDQGALDKAEAFLRDQAAVGGDTAEANQMRLIVFLREMRGEDAALEQLDRFVADGVNPALFGSIAAEIRFDAGDTAGAIMAMEALLDGAVRGRQTRDNKVSLARMLAAEGKVIEARQYVDEVLAQDVGHVEGLKIRAAWLIQDDRADDAIAALRAALDQAPLDAQAMTLMAEAHTRNGNRGLAGEMLSLAFEASGSKPEEALNYARFLAADGKDRTAEAIVRNALQVTPGDARLLSFLGQAYVARQDWMRAARIEGELRAQPTSEARDAAQALEVMRLNARQLSAEAIGFLEELTDRDGTNGAELAVVRAHFAARDYAAAERFIDAALSQDPDRPVMRYLKASLMAATGRSGPAREIYRALLEEDPTDDIVWRALYATELRDGTPETAAEVLEAALQALPDDKNLLWAKAGVLQDEGDIDGAIAVYETLYAANPASPVLANNLASLLSTYRDSPEDLERAFTVAKRLRGVSVPAFQDTYGWIAYRRGLIEEALAHLEPAAAALPDDPLVIFRLGMAYVADARDADALALFERALTLAGPDDPRAPFQTARNEVARIQSFMTGSDAN